MADSISTTRAPTPTNNRSTIPTTPAPPPPMTTDFAVIEAQKENIRPAASGRSAATLSTLLDKGNAEVDRVVQEGHDRLKRDIEEAERRDREGEEMENGYTDILDAYNRYIQYNVEHHPTSAHHLLPLIESTTRRFVDDTRFSQDTRYLKMWIMFARQTERREEIWAHLESKNIGTNHAVFYEEWAGSLEALNRKRKADEIFKLGINRRAAPVERLKTRRAAFLERIMAPDGNIPEDEPVAPARPPSARGVLAPMATPSVPGSVSGAQQSAPSMRQATTNNGRKMAVFADGDEPAEAAEGGVWADFGTRDSRRKENVVEATPWKGEVMPQSASKRMAPRTPKLEVFKDTTNDDTGAAHPADDVFQRSRTPPVSEADLIRADPLRRFDRAPTASGSIPASTLAVAPVSLPAPPSARKPPRPKKTHASGHVMSTWAVPSDGPELKDSKGRVKERRMFDWEQVYKHEDEWSFAEIRARQRGLLGKSWRGEVKEWETTWHAPGSSTPKKAVKARPPSPTVNTKLANAEVAMMFDQTIHGGKARRSNDSDSSDGSSDEDDDMAEPINVAPTPLPPKTAPIAMLRPTSDMVPPTPSPAGGASNSASSGKLNIFADENSVPSSTSRPSRFNVFGGEPVAKTPLATRTPVGSTAKPFGIFSENEDAGPGPSDTPSAVRRPALGSLFSTPAIGARGPMKMALAQAIPEEGDEEDEQLEQGQESQSGQGGEEAEGRQGQVADGPEGEEDARPGRRDWMNGINVMTPITERTCEYNTFTQLSRLSLPAAAAAAAGAITEVEEEEPVEDLEDRDEQPPMHAADDESERSRQFPERSVSVDDLPRFIDSTSPLRDSFNGFEGQAGPDFALPEGFTIHRRPLDDEWSEGVERTARLSLANTEDGDADEDGTGAFVTATAGELDGEVLKNPCCPVDEQVISALLNLIQPPLSALPGFIDERSSASNKLDGLNKFAKSRQRRASMGGSRASLSNDEGYALTLAGREYEVVDKLGEGGFGAVFLAIDLERRDEIDDMSDVDEELEDDFYVAIKVETPTAIWEAVVLDRIHRQVDETISLSIIRPKSLITFADESFLLLDYSSQGTLLDLVNKAQTLSIAPATSGSPPAVDEILAVFFTIELVRLVEQLHSNGFIHGDLKIDNCLLRLDSIPAAQGGNASWDSQYRRDGSGGWRFKGMKLIDFGRTIDLSLWPAGDAQRFVADWAVDERDCREIKEGREWSWQTDYAGLASVAYCLLFGKYIQTAEEEGKVKIATPLRRYWQTELWTDLFDLLLNSTSRGEGDGSPITAELAVVRTRFEDWLEENCQKGGKNLRAMLKKVETALMRR